ncbi:MAG: triose-phosphate isomerase [Candidatus Buchananbacteria bacterium]
MKKYFVAANWKMNLSQVQTINLAQQLVAQVNNDQVEVILCPTFTALAAVSEILSQSSLSLGSQDVFWEQRGAFTGEISAEQLKELGVTYTIVGHSERRQHLTETDLMVHQKVKASLAQNLKPIICVGETFEQRQDSQQDYVIIKQVTAALAGLEIKPEDQIIVAYEPVWVIGTGQAVLPEQANHIAKVIRQTLVDLFPLVQVKNNFRIIYGGSVDQNNAVGFLAEEVITGFLVGGASLSAEKFLPLINQLV